MAKNKGNVRLKPSEQKNQRVVIMYTVGDIKEIQEFQNAIGEPNRSKLFRDTVAAAIKKWQARQ